MRIASSLLLLAAVAGALTASAGLGYRFGLWPLGQAFDMLRIGAWASAVALGLGAFGLFYVLWRRRFVAGALTLPGRALAGVSLYAPWRMAQLAQTLPAVNDIATDPDEPPAFVALAAARAQAPNGAAWRGNAAVQRAAYGDIEPLRLKLAPATAFARVEQAARDLGWTVVAGDAAEGRLEASARTRWFGFTDDVVVRLRPEGDLTRIDVRSASRLGTSDLGANAERIRALLERLRL